MESSNSVDHRIVLHYMLSTVVLSAGEFDWNPDLQGKGENAFVITGIRDYYGGVNVNF